VQTKEHFVGRMSIAVFTRRLGKYREPFAGLSVGDIPKLLEPNIAQGLDKVKHESKSTKSNSIGGRFWRLTSY